MLYKSQCEGRACGNLYLHLDLLSLRGFKPYNYRPQFAPCLISSARARTHTKL